VSVSINPAVVVCSLVTSATSVCLLFIGLLGVDLTILVHSYGVNVTFNFSTNNNEIAIYSYYIFN